MIYSLLWLHATSVFLTVLVVLVVKKSLQHTLATLLITLIFPIGGVVLTGLVYGFNKGNVQRGHLSLDESYEFIKKEKVTFSFTPMLDFNEETNIVPLEEALLLSEVDHRREVILDILKRDVMTYANYINLALKNEDSETSHYAASGILHAKRKLDLSLNELSTLYEENTNDSSIALSYADLLDEYMRTVYLGEEDRKSYTQNSIRVLEKIIHMKWTLEQSYILQLIKLLLENQNRRKIFTYSRLFFYEYPDTEEKYVLLLECYYVLKDKKNFDFVLERFRASDLTFTNETLNLVRFWIGVII